MATTLLTPSELDALRADWSKGGLRVAFVPTMGALHAGHLALVHEARRLADRIVVSIFVNPAQFGPNEDFARYPRTLAADLALLEPLGVEAVFLPSAAAMYPEGFQTFVHNKGMAQGLCGGSRQGHFEGVLTVVLKLLQLVRPEVAVFGKKDYQQWRLIERMALDLHLPVRIVGVDTLREADGMAMSSRNRFLETAERREAAQLYQGLAAAKAAYVSGQRSAAALQQAFLEVISGAPAIGLEYAEVRRQQDLVPFAADVVDAPAVLAVAARVGSTRLIDNIEMG